MVRQAIASCVLGFCVLTSGPAWAEPEVFSKAGYEADHAKAIAEEKLHIVFVSSESCNSSQVLEHRRWPEPAIVEWMTANAIVTRLGRETAESQIRALKVLATPTTIVYRGDSEIGRTSGAWWEEDLLAWLDHLRTGDPIESIVADRIAENKSGTPILDWFYAQLAGEERHYLEENVPFLLGQEDLIPILEQLDTARVAGDIDTEIRLCLWLIRNGNRVFAVSPDPVSLAVSNLTEGVHNGRLTDVAIRSLVEALEPQARGYATLLPSEPGPRGETEFEPLQTWVSLSGVIQNWDVLVEWTIERLEIDEQELRNSGFNWVCEESAINTNRWDVLARLIPDPVAAAKSVLEMPLVAMGFDMMMGGDADETQMDRMKDAVAWGIYHPAIVALTADDEGATLARFLSTVEEGMGSAHHWRVVVLFAASRVEKLDSQHIEWIQAYDLSAHYPQYADQIRLIQEAWQLK